MQLKNIIDKLNYKKMEAKNKFQQIESQEQKEKAEQEAKKLLKLTINGLIKLNGKELKEKGYIDFSDKAIRGKLLVLFNSFENSKTLSESTKKFLSAFKENFLNPQNEHIIKFLKEKLILNNNQEINEENIEEYFSIIKQGVLTLNDVGKNANKNDIDFYIAFIEKFSSSQELLSKFPDLNLLLKDFLPSLSRVISKEELSKALDSLFKNSKQDILKILKGEELSKEQVYNIKLNTIHNLASFLKTINNENVSDIIFQKLPQFSFIKNNPSLNNIIITLEDANLSKQDKLKITSYLFDSIQDLSTPNLSEQQINQFSKKTIDFLNFISHKIPEEKFKYLLKELLKLSDDGSNQIELEKLLKYVKNLDYGEIFQLLKANFGKILDIAKKLLDKGINKISLEDFLLEVFKSNILNDISKDLGYKLVEEIREIASLDIKQVLIEGRKELLGTNFSLKGKLNQKLKSSLDGKTSGKIAQNLVDGLIQKFENQIKYEINKLDEKLTKQEIVDIFKNQAQDFIKNQPKLLIDFIKEAGYKIDEKDIKLVQEFAQKVIHHPKFDHIINIFIDNFSNIALAKQDIISSFREIIKEIKEKTPEIFSKEVGQDVKQILLDTIYSNSFNEQNISQLINFLEKNDLTPKNIDKDKLAKFIILLPEFLPKNKAGEILNGIDFKNLDKLNYNELILKTYKGINDKIRFINKILDLDIFEKSDSKQEKLTSSQIHLVTELVYDTIKNSDEISLSETVEKIFQKTGNERLNEIKVFNQNLSYLVVDFVQATPKENFRQLLNYINENILGKENLTKQDYIKLGEKVLSLTNSEKLIKQLKTETQQTEESKFLLDKFDTFKSIWKNNKDKLFYLANNSQKALNIMQTLKISNEEDKKFIKDYTGNAFDIGHKLTEDFTKEEFKQLLDIVVNKKYPVDGIDFGGDSFNLSEEKKSKLAKSFIFNNFLFSLGTLFDFVKNGFKLEQADVIYNYLKDGGNKDDLQDTILDALSMRKQKLAKNDKIDTDNVLRIGKEDDLMNDFT